MRLITRDVRAKEIIEEWYESYHRYWDNPQYAGGSRRTYERLLALGDTPKLEDVYAITKHPYHEHAIICDSCSCEADIGVRLVEERLCHDIQGCDVCAECISKAMGMIPKPAVPVESEHRTWHHETPESLFKKQLAEIAEINASMDAVSMTGHPDILKQIVYCIKCGMCHKRGDHHNCSL